ncbi:MAG: DNA-directed RNA polymerase subunit omega [Melioribacteraceae bacterium]
MAIRPINLTKIKASIPNLYEAVIIAARRARKINDDNKTEFNSLLGTMTSGHEDDFEERENPEQMKLSLEFEKREKAHIQSLHELVDNKIEYRYKDVKDK